MKPFKKHIKPYTVILLLCLAILTTYITGTLYARYVSGDSDQDAAQVAGFDIQTDLTAKTEEIVLENIKPGYTKTVELNVTNNSEVSVSYEFKVDSSGNLPLTYTFSSGRMGQLLVGSTSSAHHTLTISWPETENDVSFVSEVDIVSISVTCTQID